MNEINLVGFDLSGITGYDYNAEAKSLFQAGSEFDLEITLEDFERSIGTHKIHLYQFFMAKTCGRAEKFEQLAQDEFPENDAEAMKIFPQYLSIMVVYCRNNVLAMPGSEIIFEWCPKSGIEVVTYAGFHRDENYAIVEEPQRHIRTLVDLTLDVKIPLGIGKPLPYLIFHAMQTMSMLHEVIKIGNTPADLRSGYHAGCLIKIGVLIGAKKEGLVRQYPHTHLLPCVCDLPALIVTTCSSCLF